ncbi:MAG TPA: hypothetical protein VMJ14_13910 [Burkholderiales bacterium]|nr:hypothetical protein [Burkholderiales bacterium]
MNYGDIALGVECALPRNIELARPGARFGQFMKRFFAAIARRT